MADFGAFQGAQLAAAVGSNSAASKSTVLTSPGSNNTKGAFAQLSASTAYDCAGIVIAGSVAGSAALSVLIDIAIGAAGVEQVIVPNILQRRIASANAGITPMFIPVSIPAGSRISARYQYTDSSAIVGLSFVALSGTPNYGIYCSNSAATYGALTASSSGVVVDPGATANTKGAYTELVSATAGATNWLIVSAGPDATVLANADWLMDIAIGASGSEQVILPDVHLYSSTTTNVLHERISIPLAIPAGVRVAARLQCASTAAGRTLQLTATAI